MARLTAEQKTFIVQRLACFDTPSTVAEAVKEEFGVDLTRQHVEQYDPTKRAGQALSVKYREIFEQTREKFKSDTSEIPVAHKSVRLLRLQRMADRCERMKNFALAAQLLEQVAKEMGDHYTNLRRVAPVDPTGERPYEPQQYTPEQLDARIRELQNKLKED